MKVKATAINYILKVKPNQLYADIVLLTLPFTLLREVEINVDLPRLKRNAIMNLSYGNNSKLIVRF